MRKLLPIILFIFIMGGICMAETLQEHEDKFWRDYNDPNEPQKCGVSCPKCGEQLYADYSICLTSNPAQTPIFCKKCGYKGSMH